MTLVLLKFDGFEAIAPCIMDAYLSLKINVVFMVEVSLLSSRQDSGTGIMELQWILRRNRLKMDHMSLSNTKIYEDSNNGT